MRLKLRCVKTAVFDFLDEEAHYSPNDTIYAEIHDNGDMYLSKTPHGVYCGPYNPSDIGEYFVSEFDEDEYYKHCKQARNVSMYDANGLVIATADNVVYFE